ncbi:MAG: hypothetical protein GY839_10725 [candidate division Zixibacteria bacterium]|nr:hypothetical protein [candidate division Zixibacteria bacterium]
MKLAETGDKFRAIAKVYKKYRFTELPSIALYFVGGGEYITNTLRCNYQYVLFNLDDSTMYHFGGKSSQFSRVFSGYLQKKYEPDSILNLLYLFVNTVDSECSYYMIENLQDYDDWHGDHVPWRYEENKKLINNYIKPVHINQYNDYYEVEFYTWHKKMGMMVKLTLDYWKFRITKNEIQLLERIKRQPDYYNGF